MTVEKSGKPPSPDVAGDLILEAFNTSEDFDRRLSQIVAPDMPGPRVEVPDLVFHQPFSEEAIDRLTSPGKSEPQSAQQANPRRESGNAEVGIDPEHAQYQFYIKRLQEKQEEYPEDSTENALKQSANVLLYILETFEYEIDEERRDKIIRRMRRILGLLRETSVPDRVREGFRSQRLHDKVEALYKRHMRRYALHRMETKKQEALQEQLKRVSSEADERAQAEQRRYEKEKRLAQTSQTISEEKLRQLEEEFDAMIALSASNHGISTAKLMRFGYEDPDPADGSSPPMLSTAGKTKKPGKTGASKGPKSNASLMPPGRAAGHSRMPRGPKSSASVMPGAKSAKSATDKQVPERQVFLTPQQIIERNNERRRLRALALKKE
ncbi:MAG: hypothetical protein H6R18_574 [Proteobacteria bacterium]|nr:hypothetical protein [Pseudomonadota bacterium]